MRTTTFTKPRSVTVVEGGGGFPWPAIALVVAAAVLARAGLAVAHQAGALLRDVLAVAAALAFSGLLARCGLAFSRWERRREVERLRAAEPVRVRWRP